MIARPAISAHGFALELEPAIGGAITAFRLTREGRPPIALMRETAPGPLGDALDAACFPLVPYCNRIRGGRFSFRGRDVRLSPNMAGDPSPLHGQGWRGAWDLADLGQDQAELRFLHDAGEWPWTYEATSRMRLEPSGLACRLSVINRSEEPMPAGLGYHPYWPVFPDTVLTTEVETVWTVDKDVLPITEEPARGRYDLHERLVDRAGLDNGFGGWSGHAEVRRPDCGLVITIESEVRFFQLYAPASGGVIVAEPVTHANDVLSHPESEWPRLGMAVLEPDAELVLEARFIISRF
jgi:aldose 1-epimerase